MGDLRRRRLTWMASGAAGITLVAAAAIIVVERYRDEVQEVTIDDAVENFQARSPSTLIDVDASPGDTARSSSSGAVADPDSYEPTTTARTAAELRLPDDGVYDYAATGQEQVDVLTGATHVYPAETAVVVEPFGCGSRLTWMPFVERTEGWDTCVRDGGIALVSYTATHEFFNSHEVRHLVCTEPAWIVPPPDAPTTMTATCEGDGLSEVRTTTVVGTSTVTVGGVDVATIELDVAVETSGTTTGASTRHLVVDARSGLPINWSDTVANTTPTPVGDAHYDESFTLTVMSLSPRT
ncbi:MAG: hypothetical protein WBP59_13595 [Ilumatobacteraceae bacterium]